MRGILHLLLLSWCIYSSLEAPAAASTDKGPISSEKVNTIATIQPQANASPTPKRVTPTLNLTTVVAGGESKPKSEEVAKLPVSSANTTTVLQKTTEQSSPIQQEDPEDDNDEEPKPPVEEEEQPEKVDEPKKAEIEKPSPKKENPAPVVAEKTEVDNLAQPEDSNFLSFMLVGILLVVCIYLLQHNKKKILGLMFEGRSTRGRNVRYRRLSQHDDEQYKNDIIY